MKKQSLKKLSLGRETVRILNERLDAVAGGFTRITCANSCDTAINSHCDTCQQTSC
jgi:hypothetical protein